MVYFDAYLQNKRRSEINRKDYSYQVKYKNEYEHQWFLYFVYFLYPIHVMFYHQNNSRDIFHLDEREDHESNYHDQSKQKSDN
jgi:hypothetical protein